MNLKFEYMKKLMKKAQVVVDEDPAAANAELADPAALASKLILNLRQETGAGGEDLTAPDFDSNKDSALLMQDVQNLRSFFDWIIKNNITYKGEKFVWDGKTFDFSSTDVKNKFLEDHPNIQAWRVFDVQSVSATTTGTNTKEDYRQQDLTYYADKVALAEYMKSIADIASKSKNEMLNMAITKLELDADTALKRENAGSFNATQAVGLLDTQLLDAFNSIADYSSIGDLITAKYDDAKIGSKFKYKLFGKDIKSADTLKSWMGSNNLVDDNNKNTSDSTYNPCWIIMQLYKRLKNSALPAASEDLKTILNQYLTKLDSLSDKCVLDGTGAGKQKQDTSAALTSDKTTEKTTDPQQNTVGSDQKSKLDSVLYLMNAVATNANQGNMIPLDNLDELLQYLKGSNLFSSTVGNRVNVCLENLASISDLLSDPHHTKVPDLNLINPQRTYLSQLIAGRGGNPNANFTAFSTQLTMLCQELHTVLQNIFDQKNLDPYIISRASVLLGVVEEWTSGLNAWFSPQSLASAYTSAMQGK